MHPLLLLLLPKTLTARLLATIAALSLLLLLAGRHIVRLNGIIAAKPKIEVRWKERVHTVIEKGPERIVTRTIKEPSGTVTVVKEVFRDPIVKTTDADRRGERRETPVGLNPKLWSVTAVLNPLDYKHGAALGLSRSFGPMSIGYAHTIDRAVKFSDGHRVAIGLTLF